MCCSGRAGCEKQVKNLHSIFLFGKKGKIIFCLEERIENVKICKE